MKKDKMDKIIKKQLKDYSLTVNINNSVMQNIKNYETNRRKRLYYLEILLSVLTASSLFFSVFLINYIITPLKVLTFFFNPLNLDSVLFVRTVQGIFILFILITFLAVRYFYIDSHQRNHSL